METPPTAASLSCLYPHKRYQDPKINLFIDFMIARCRAMLKESQAAYQLPR